MSSSQLVQTFLKDYSSSPYSIQTVELDITIHEEHCDVKSSFTIRPERIGEPLTLNGEHLTLFELSINGTPLNTDQYQCVDDHLIIPNCPTEPFVLDTHVSINPYTNKALEGLYVSSGLLCTQNEPEGFRRITYFLDRPDILSRYKTTLRAKKERYPILLANGNCIHRQDLSEGWHEVCWEDPFPKPSYLFAIVACDLGHIQDTFITQSGRSVALEIYCKKGLEDRCWHAMASLKHSMKWDEDTFGLEYDLDLFMIVAVDDFNAGAMENKGLNIFNSALIFADSRTATDSDYQRIEAVIAHEYFHNWTGNRVTCRDWFQLTLKEGLTVFRDELFSADMHSETVKRIDDVALLRTVQFTEDASPMAHPIRPAAYAQIDNFYTSTVYNKGAEIIRMIHTLVGPTAFRKGIDLYFERFDGQAVTTEDFISAMADASGQDFSRFQVWYHQAGTPHCECSGHYNTEEKTYTLAITQSCRPTPESPDKKPFFIPLRLGLVSQSGVPLTFQTHPKTSPQSEWTFPITDTQTDLTLYNVQSEPSPSLFRHFSAPITFNFDYSAQERLALLQSDTDGFTRYDAGQQYLKTCIQNQRTMALNPQDIVSYCHVLESIILQDDIDPAFRAVLLSIPSLNECFHSQSPIAIHDTFQARETVLNSIIQQLEPLLFMLYQTINAQLSDAHDTRSMALRRLKNTCLVYLSRLPHYNNLCRSVMKSPVCFTDEWAALRGLTSLSLRSHSEAILAFRDKWKDEPLIIQKWMAVQAVSQDSRCLDNILKLQKDTLYQAQTPNFIRSLIGSFSQNVIHFHSLDGSGYRFFADQIITVDQFNPSIAARLANAFKLYPKLDPKLQSLLHVQLNRILSAPSLSTNTQEICYKIQKSVSMEKASSSA